MTARRGDLVIVQRSTLEATRDGRGKTVHRFRVARVTSITREGLVKAFQEYNATTPYQVKHEPRSTRYHIVPQGKIDVEAALATAPANPWNTGGGHLVKPYYSMTEGRASLN